MRENREEEEGGGGGGALFVYILDTLFTTLGTTVHMHMTQKINGRDFGINRKANCWEYQQKQCAHFPKQKIRKEKVK